MKSQPGDHRHRLLIGGVELQELKRHTDSMAEAFGLDRKIESYKGTRPITLYRWDLDCLMDVIDLALSDKRGYPSGRPPATWLSRRWVRGCARNTTPCKGTRRRRRSARRK